MTSGAGEFLRVVGLTIRVLTANVLGWKIAYMKRLGVRHPRVAPRLAVVEESAPDLRALHFLWGCTR
jgi:hypothetical protein